MRLPAVASLTQQALRTMGATPGQESAATWASVGAADLLTAATHGPVVMQDSAGAVGSPAAATHDLESATPGIAGAAGLRAAADLAGNRDLPAAVVLEPIAALVDSTVAIAALEDSAEPIAASAAAGLVATVDLAAGALRHRISAVATTAAAATVTIDRN